MSFLQAIFLGIVQGVAEFLPISSSGHLVLAESALGLHFENLAFNVALHVGTLLSILIVYRREILSLLRRPRLVVAIVVATLPIVVVGLFFRDALERAFDSPFATGIALCATAGLLWSTQWVDRGRSELDDIRWQQALVVGLFQAIAPIPGISRSGITIFAGLLSGMTRQTAAAFSFLIAIPAILGAATLETLKLRNEQLSQYPWDVYGVGAIVAFVVGVVALKGLIRVISARRLYLFAWYCLAMGIAAIVLSLR